MESEINPNIDAIQQNATLPKGFAIAALVLSVLALLDSFIPIVNIIAIIMAILALIFGLLGISRARKGEAGGKGFAIGGVVIGTVALVSALVVNVAFGILFNVAMQDEDVQAAIAEIIDKDGYDDDSNLYPDERDQRHHASVATSPADDSAAWTTMEFCIGSNSFKLMETTLQNLASKTGWKIDLESDEYTSSTMIMPHGDFEDDLILVELEDPEDSHNSLWVLLVNPTNAPLNIMDCLISSVDADTYRSTFDFTVCGVGLGNSIDDVITALGDPQDVYESDDDITLSYETSDYSKIIEFTAMDGKTVDEIELSIMLF